MTVQQLRDLLAPLPGNLEVLVTLDEASDYATSLDGGEVEERYNLEDPGTARTPVLVLTYSQSSTNFGNEPAE